MALLPESARALVAVAAVAGWRVPRALLTAVVSQNEEDMLTGLEEACRARLLVEAGDGASAFPHDLIREVVEADISTARRAVLHRRVAEAWGAEPRPAAAEQLAYHFGRSDVQDKAVPYFELAGDEAWSQGAQGAAERHFCDLLERLRSLDRVDDARRIREKLANVRYETGHYGAAVELLETVADELAAAGDWGAVARVAARIGWAHWRGGTIGDGVARVERLLEVLHRRGEQSPPALCAALGQLLFGAGQYSKSLTATEQAVELARASGDDRVRAMAEAQLMNILQTSGSVEDAVRVSREVVTSIEEVGDLDALRMAHSVLTYIRGVRGDLEAARLHAGRARVICERIGDQVSLSFPLAVGAWIDTLAGDWRSARNELERAIDLSHRADHSWYGPYPSVFLARLLLVEGAWEAAAAVGHEALAVAEESKDLQAVRWTSPTMAELEIRQGHPEAAVARLEPLLDRPGLEECDVTSLLPVLAWAHLDAGRVEEAGTLVQQALIRARREGMRPTLVEALRLRAMVLMRGERWAAAARDLEEGLALARSIPYPYAEARLLRAESKLYCALGERRLAGERLEEAATIFRRLGAARDIERLDRLPV